MDEVEGISEMVTGAALARAVEPGAGEAREARAGVCLNCGTALAGPHCHQCGQAAHVHRTLSAWWHDLAHGVLHLDGKIWRTLPLLALKPGELTRRYVDGERAKFVSPIAVFLFSVFLMFAVFSMVGGPVGGDGASAGNGDDPAAERAKAEREFKQEAAEAQAGLDKARVERARLAAAGQSTAQADADIRRLEKEIALERRLFNDAMDLIGTEEAREMKAARAEAEARQPGALKKAVEQAEEGDIVVLSGADSLNAWFTKAYRKAKDNPSLLFYKLQTNAYKFSWLLIPISVPFVWMLFLHRRRYRQFKAYDHTVFVTYSIAFMSLGVIALSVLRPLGLPAAIAGLAMVFVPPIHMYRQLRGAYSLSRWSALWRTFVLLNFTGVAIGLFASLLLALGLLG
jgi:hypothetical protein